MSFELKIQPTATADIEEIHAFLTQYSPAVADQTFDLIQRAIFGLCAFPKRYAVAPESARSSVELRHLIVGNYRAIYAIIGDAVTVYRVLHAAQKPADPADFL